MFNENVAGYFQLDKVKGNIGVEIEMETENPFSPKFLPEIWVYDDEEYSIKGYGGEILTRHPIYTKDLGEVLKELKSNMKDYNVNIKPSVRAAVHIHVNVQDMTIGEVFKFMMCYYALETVLTNFCGDGRQGNLFCMRVRDCLYIPEQLCKAVGSKDIHSIRSDDLRYSSLNFQNLFSYGSLEFRSLRTEPDLNNIEDWVKILMRIKNYSKNINSCWEEICAISGVGPSQWAKSILGKKLFDMVKYNDLEKDIMTDIRNIQMLVHKLNLNGV